MVNASFESGKFTEEARQRQAQQLEGNTSHILLSRRHIEYNDYITHFFAYVRNPKPNNPSHSNTAPGTPIQVHTLRSKMTGTLKNPAPVSSTAPRKSHTVDITASIPLHIQSTNKDPTTLPFDHKNFIFTP